MPPAQLACRPVAPTPLGQDDVWRNLDLRKFCAIHLPRGVGLISPCGRCLGGAAVAAVLRRRLHGHSGAPAPAVASGRILPIGSSRHILSRCQGSNPYTESIKKWGAAASESGHIPEKQRFRPSPSASNLQNQRVSRGWSAYLDYHFRQSLLYRLSIEAHADEEQDVALPLYKQRRARGTLQIALHCSYPVTGPATVSSSEPGNGA
jgi:hypothetical protein